MKPRTISLHNYGSHVDTRVEFDGARLVALIGPMGAGKSSLMESLKYIFYDDARLRTDGLVRIGATDMSATVEFAFAGATYRAVRGRTTKGAGKSYLELHVQAPDGSWTPLTGDDIRGTQGAIAELLGLDANAFGTAVFLGQGDLKRFVEATAGERKRILSTVLGLDVYARAETRAREEARDLEARTVAERGQVERLTDAIAELAGAPAIVAEREAEISGLEAAIAVDRARRGKITERLTELAGEIAKGDAAAAEVARLEEERAALAGRYLREKATITASEEAHRAATAALSAAGAVERAATDIPAAQAEVASLEAAEGADRRLSDELGAARQAFEAADRPIREALASWTAELSVARRRVDELLTGVNALEPVICEKCQHPNVVDQAGLRHQLADARRLVTSLEAAEPEEPSTHRRDRAALARLESRRREATFDPRPLAEARAQLTTLERTAARAGEISAARTALDAAAGAKASAEAELVSIEKAGKAIAGRIETAKAATAATATLMAEQASLTADAKVLDDSMDIDGRRLRDLEGLLAAARANAGRLEQLQGERNALVAGLAESDAELGRLRRLVTAFGVGGIPARIMDGVLPELASSANELLAELVPGMTVELRGQRAKKDGKGVVEALDIIVRDDVGERPIEAYSGGETTSVCLANAVALSRLGAHRSGRPIELLVIDEPEGLDDDGRRALMHLLRGMTNAGTLGLVVLITHYADLADLADTVWSVSKDGDGSVVTEAA